MLIRNVSSKEFSFLHHHTYPVWGEIDTPLPALPEQVWQAVCIAERQLDIVIGHQDTKEMSNEKEQMCFLSALLNSRTLI